MSNANSASALLDLDALAARLGVGKRYVRRLIEERRIPYRKIGRLVRFDPDEVEAWIDERRVDAFSQAGVPEVPSALGFGSGVCRTDRL